MAYKLPWEVEFAVFVDGVDVTRHMNPYLEDLSVEDKDGMVTDTAELTFSDADGQLLMPNPGGSVLIAIQGIEVFEGVIDEVRSRCTRTTGRQVSVSAKGFDSFSKPKEVLTFHKDKTTFGEFLTEAARRAGVSITIDPRFAGLQREWWAAYNESFLHLGTRLAMELGATFKIQGGKAVFAARGTGQNANGATMPTVSGAWGQNLLAWDIAPLLGRPRFSAARSRYFDREEGRWIERSTTINPGNFGPAGAEAVNRAPKADGDHADNVNTATAEESERGRGEGTAVIMIEPAARVEGSFLLIGARPGVDGSYRITGVRHSLARGEGSTTAVELKQPAGDAGVDSRTNE